MQCDSCKREIKDIEPIYNMQISRRDYLESNLVICDNCREDILYTIKGAEERQRRWVL